MKILAKYEYTVCKWLAPIIVNGEPAPSPEDCDLNAAALQLEDLAAKHAADLNGTSYTIQWPDDIDDSAHFARCEMLEVHADVVDITINIFAND